jgi:hypothetical protein
VDALHTTGRRGASPGGRARAEASAGDAGGGPAAGGCVLGRRAGCAGPGGVVGGAAPSSRATGRVASNYSYTVRFGGRGGAGRSFDDGRRWRLREGRVATRGRGIGRRVDRQRRHGGGWPGRPGVDPEEHRALACAMSGDRGSAPAPGRIIYIDMGRVESGPWACGASLRGRGRCGVGRPVRGLSAVGPSRGARGRKSRGRCRARWSRGAGG